MAKASAWTNVWLLARTDEELAEMVAQVVARPWTEGIGVVRQRRLIAEWGRRQKLKEGRNAEDTP
jgi:hypothetical protein